MKRKGQIILVTMLAVIFMATTVHAGGWWSHALDKMWHKVEKKIHKLEKKTKWNAKKIKQNSKKIRRNSKKIKHNSRKIKHNSRKIKRVDRKVDRKHRRHNRWHKKKKHRNNRGSGVDMEALTAEILAALKADAAFTDSLKGEPGKDGGDGPMICPGCNFSDSETKRFVERDFTNAFLNWAYFVGTDLSGAVFTDADLKHASFKNATVGGAVFEGADLSEADMSITNWLGVDLSKADSVKGAMWVFEEYVDYDYVNYKYIYNYISATCPDGTLATDHLKVEGDLKTGTCENNLIP